MNQIDSSYASSGRRIINIGPHQSALLQGTDFGRSYDQKFDQSTSLRLEQALKQPDQLVSQSQQQQKGGITPYQQQHAATHHPTGGSPQRQQNVRNSYERQNSADPYDKNFVQTTSSGIRRLQTQQPEHTHDHQQLKAPLQHQHHDLATIASQLQGKHTDELAQSSRFGTDHEQLPGSLRTHDQHQIKAIDHSRNPQKIEGLFEFLREEHYKFYGVHSTDETELFKFWKNFISVAHREKKWKKHYQKTGTQVELQSARKNSPIKIGKENIVNPFVFNHNATLEIKKSAAVRLFQDLYEMDVAYTLNKVKTEQNDKQQIENMKRTNEFDQYQKRELKAREEAVINEMMSAFYNEHIKQQTLEFDIKIQRIKQVEEYKKAQLQTNSSAQSVAGGIRSNNKTPEQINPLESIEDSSHKHSHPLLPTTNNNRQQQLVGGKVQPLGVAANQTAQQQTIALYEQQKNKIRQELEEEQRFMTHLMYLSRELNLSNDYITLSRMYKDQPDKTRVGITWKKGEEETFKIIKQFFGDESLLKRILLFYHMKNKHTSQKNISLLGFYTQQKKRTLLLSCISRPKSMKKLMCNLCQMKDEGSRDPNCVVCIKSIEQLLSGYELHNKIITGERNQMAYEDQLAAEQRHKNYLMKKVFGKDKTITANKLEELAKPKDKWKRGRRLLELQKQFPHDMVLQKMIHEEFKENKVFKYPEEYDVYDDQEDMDRKIREKRTIKVKDESKAKLLREKFNQTDGQKLYYEKIEGQNKRNKERELERYIIEKVRQYLNMKKNRLTGKDQVTIRQYLSTSYKEMIKHADFGKLAHTKFPHITYGTKPDSETAKKSFPTSWKSYFFRILKSFIKTSKGLGRLKNAPPTFMLPGGKRCTIHQFTCPEDCQYTTLNKRVVLRTSLLKRRERDPRGYRARVWRRKDHESARHDVLMLESEIANCTFEPAAGSMNKNIAQAKQAVPNLEKDGMFKEPDLFEYVEKLGTNFKNSNPDVFKSGILKKAQIFFKQGKYNDAMLALEAGFNIESLKKHYDRKYYQKVQAERERKEKADRELKQKQMNDARNGRSFPVKDVSETQKKMPEEDYENKKLQTVLLEAFELIKQIEDIKKAKQKEIDKITNGKRGLKSKVRNFDRYQKSQTKVDTSMERVLFRTVMCPMKDKCPKDVRPRWPTSNIKTQTKFGDECPFAHHPMDLTFPETLLTKLNSTKHTVQNLKSQMQDKKQSAVFKPAGRLFECKGCAQSSSMHMGGPCNLCRYKQMADAHTNKFIDKVKNERFRRSMSRHESPDITMKREEMKSISKRMNETDDDFNSRSRHLNQVENIYKHLALDDNFTIKFGMLKKACVLYFYGRYNDAFDVVAKAAKIVQDQKEIEKDKQKIIEKRWKFKLGLEDGFELPIPVETIDITKVDEKFLKKLDMPGVSVQTLKLYIEQVSPMKSEEYSKHRFLNKLIEDHYMMFEEAILKKQNTIKTMKKQVEKLDEEADMADAFGSSPERSPENKDLKGGMGGDHRSKSKKKKVKMCPILQEKGMCHLNKEKKCHYAHNPIELDLIPPDVKIKNLNGVIISQTHKLKHMKTLEPWRPAKAGQIEHTWLMDLASKKRKKDDEDEDSPKRKEVVKKSIFERENILKKPFEKE